MGQLEGTQEMRCKSCGKATCLVVENWDTISRGGSVRQGRDGQNADHVGRISFAWSRVGSICQSCCKQAGDSAQITVKPVLLIGRQVGDAMESCRNKTSYSFPYSQGRWSCNTFSRSRRITDLQAISRQFLHQDAAITLFSTRRHKEKLVSRLLRFNHVCTVRPQG